MGVDRPSPPEGLARAILGSLSASEPPALSPSRYRSRSARSRTAGAASRTLAFAVLAALAAPLTGCYTRFSPPAGLDRATALDGERTVVYDVVPIYYEWYGGFGPYLSYYGYHHHHGEVSPPGHGPQGPAPIREGFGRGGRGEAAPSRDVVPVRPAEPPRDRPSEPSEDKPEEKKGSIGDRGGRK